MCFGYTHAGDELNVHFNEAATGALVGTADAHLMTGIKGVTEPAHLAACDARSHSDRPLRHPL